MSHQVGSFVGAYGGGLIYDALGSYNMAWQIGVAVGLAASIVQIAFALNRRRRRPCCERHRHRQRLLICWAMRCCAKQRAARLPHSSKLESQRIQQLE